MVPVCRQSDRMAQVHTVMERLMAAGLILGFAEVLALAEVSVGVGEEAAVEADSDLGGISRVASKPQMG